MFGQLLEFHEEGPVSCISKVSPQVCQFQPCFFSKKSLAAVGFGIMPWMTWMVISPLLGVNHVNAGIGLMMVGWPGPPKAYLTMALTGGDWLCLMRLLKHWWGKAGSDHREVASGVIKRGKILEVNGWRLKCWECHETKWRIVQILQQRRGMLNRVWWCVVLRALSFCRVGLIKQCRQHLRSSVPNR
jgi:hypothetical protein